MEALASSTLPFLHSLADLRLPVLTWIFEKLTLLGDEKLFVAVALIFFWCVSKRGGLYVMTAGFSAASLGESFKLLFRIPRRWVLDESLEGKVVPSARESTLLGEGAVGWSFPSGHTLISVATYGGLAAWFREKWIMIPGILLAVLIPFTRLYLGVHTPLDILCGALLSIVILLLLRPLFRAPGDAGVRAALIGSTALAAALLVVLYVFRPASLSEADSELYATGIKNLWQLVGAALAAWLAFEADTRWIHFDTKAVWWVQLIKIAGGSILLLGLQTLVKKLFGYTKPVTLDNMTRNGIISCAANFLGLGASMILWPLCFPRLSALAKK